VGDRVPDDHSWIEVPDAFDDRGNPVHDRGVSTVHGLYFLGLAWLHTAGSALLGFVGRDAAHLADVISKRCRGDPNERLPGRDAL
jgi:putative flavoprotein involved in K+ transport